MNDFLDVPNPENKINDVLDIAIESRENKIKQIEGEIDSVKKQKGSGVYYIEMANKDEPSIEIFGKALVSITGDILSGFSDAAKKLKRQADAVHGDSNAKDISEQADKLDKIIGKVQKKTSELVEKVGGLQKGGRMSKTTDNNTSSLENKHKNKNEQEQLADSSTSIMDDAKNIGAETASQIKDMGIASVKTGVKWSADFISDMIDMGMEMTGEANILDTPVDELSPKLNKNILLLAGLLKEVSENPATREAVKEVAEAIAISIIEILDEIRPALNEVTDKSIDMLEEVGMKSVRGATSTGISVAQAFIAEIPWVGGIIDMMIAIGKGFNVLMEAFKIVVAKGGPISIKGVQTVVDTEQTVEKGVDRIETAASSAMDAIKQTTKQGQTGGLYIPNKQLNSKIQRGGKRLRKTMKMFSSTLPMLKFSCSNSRDTRKRKKQGGKSRKNLKTNVIRTNLRRNSRRKKRN
jgi:hypothetical protein